jgi:phosphate starvation-inducible PhoH-like protein
VNLTLPLDQPAKRVALFGPTDRNLRTIRQATGARVVGRDDEIRLAGEPQAVEKAAAVLGHLQQRLRTRAFLTPEDIGDAIGKVAEEQAQQDGSGVEVFGRGKRIQAKTAGQQRYLDAIFSHDLTFCTGPAGTGKTYLAVAAAASMLKKGTIKKIVLVRPAVEAGERLGFLPGDLQAKVNPYLRPLFDALGDMIDFEQVKRFMVNDVVEVVPLAFMRGRTLNESVVIMDEAQNTTVGQMLMFLTRMGNASKMIVTGDVRQNDLPDDVPSGLVDALQRLRGNERIARVRLERTDVVRHPLVRDIIEAYGEEVTV